MARNSRQCVVFFADRDEPTAASAVESLARLRTADPDVRVFDDPARLAVRDPQPLRDLARLDIAAMLSPYTPRALAGLIDHAGGEMPCCLCRARSWKLAPPEEIVRELTDGDAPAPGRAELEEASDLLREATAESDDWRAWYPVIDYGRCNACKQCASFCLFGVYTLSEGRVEVARPAHCKNNCPACARLCPQGAIIFPKFPEPPINGGEEPSDQPSRVDLDALMDGDVLEALRKRGIDASDPAVRKRMESMLPADPSSRAAPPEGEDGRSCC